MSTHQYFTLWKIKCKPNYIMILTSIQNPLPCNTNHQINPLWTSTKSHFNLTTPNYLQPINFTTVQIIHHTTLKPIQSLTYHKRLAPAQYVTFFYTGFHLNELKSCELIFSANIILFSHFKSAQHNLVIELCHTLNFLFYIYLVNWRTVL